MLAVVSQAALLVAVQLHPFAALTPKLPLPLANPTDAVCGLVVNEQLPTCRQLENSDVLPVGSVAVELM